MNLLFAMSLLLHSGDAEDRAAVLVVVGVPGEPEYETQFQTWADRWRTAAERDAASVAIIGESDDSEVGDAEQLRKTLDELSTRSGNAPLWLVLIGHGSFDGRTAKFNLRGPDVSAAELRQWLKPIERPLVLLNCASASSPFINELSAPNRVIVTATRSGDESNFARFGDYLSEAIADPAADLDKDGQVSLLEAFLSASGRTEEFYRTESRLATEHALLDDNGDGLGTPADWFRGIHAVKSAKDGAKLDGIRAHQIHLVPSERERLIPPEIRAERDSLERDVAALRGQKDRMSEEDYYSRLQDLMVELAHVYREIEAKNGPGSEAAE